MELAVKMLKKSTTQTNDATLSQRYEQLLRSEKYADCVFHVCGKLISCHKLILSAASPVFEAMFYGPLQEQQLPIDIPDISGEIFQILINYIYSGVVDYAPLTLAQIIELHYSAEKYLLDDLNADSLQAVRQKLRFNNILPALDLGVRMHLDKLSDICLKFLQGCCLTDAMQFSSHLQQHYVHVSKQCLQAILSALPSAQQQQQLRWLIIKWCQQECLEYGMQATDCALLLHDLQMSTAHSNAAKSDTTSSISLMRERAYFKASRPFCVNEHSCAWKLQLQTARFVQLSGITMHSRLKPLLQLAGAANWSLLQLPDDYNEQLHLEISSLTPVAAPNGSDDESDQENDVLQPQVIWQHKLLQRSIKYNCDFNIGWEPGVVLSPDLSYELCIKWPESAFGAEYPCSLLSNNIDSIQLRDNMPHTGSLIKGLRFTQLV